MAPPYRDEVIKYIEMIARASTGDPSAEATLIPISRRSEDGPKILVNFHPDAPIGAFQQKLMDVFPRPTLPGDARMSAAVTVHAQDNVSSQSATGRKSVGVHVSSFLEAGMLAENRDPDIFTVAKKLVTQNAGAKAY